MIWTALGLDNTRLPAACGAEATPGGDSRSLRVNEPREMIVAIPAP
jgi:hypothetical protein